MHRSFSAEAEEEEVELEQVPVSRIFKLNAPEWPFIVLGSIGAIFSGAIQPAFAVIFAEVLGVCNSLGDVTQALEIYHVTYIL